MAEGAYGKDRFAKRNDVVRLEGFDTLDDDVAITLHSFFRALGAPHLVAERVEPALASGESRLFTAVRDRPWPPWGVGARKATAVTQVQEIGQGLFGLGPVHVGPQDEGNLGLQAALLKEVLDYATSRERAEIAYLVLEGSVLSARVLVKAGFTQTEDVVLAETGRYVYYRADAAATRKWLGLDRLSTPELLANEIDDEAFERVALFLGPLVAAGQPRPWEELIGRELIAIDLGLFNASLPGGVPPSPPTALPIDFEPPIIEPEF